MPIIPHLDEKLILPFSEIQTTILQMNGTNSPSESWFDNGGLLNKGANIGLTVTGLTLTTL